MTIDLSGRSALVVGASSGIGRVAASELTELGAKVVWCARRGDQIDVAISESGGEGLACVADISTESGCVSIAQAIGEQLDTIDLVIISSGASSVKMLTDADDDYWARILRTNVIGPSLVIRHLYRHLAPNAVVVMLSSESVGRPYPGLVPYAVSKAALEELIRGWRAEHPEIRFARVTVGATDGTDFARDFDPEISAGLYHQWLSLRVIPEQAMHAAEVGVSIARTFGHAVLVPGIDVQDLVLSSPGPSAFAPAEPGPFPELGQR